MSSERQAVQAMLLAPQTLFCLPDKPAIDSQLMPAMECKLSHAWGADAQKQRVTRRPWVAARKRQCSNWAEWQAELYATLDDPA